jgi:hypothetical protein
MLVKYFIGISPGISGSHRVHKEDCPFLPESGKRIYLGVFQSPGNAVSESRRFFKRSVKCPFCCKDHRTQAYKAGISGELLTGNFTSSDQFVAASDSVLRCCIN